MTRRQRYLALIAAGLGLGLGIALPDLVVRAAPAVTMLAALLITVVFLQDIIRRRRAELEDRTERLARYQQALNEATVRKPAAGEREPGGPDPLAAADGMDQVIEYINCFRAKLQENGYSETAAEAMAIEFHRMLSRHSS